MNIGRRAIPLLYFSLGCLFAVNARLVAAQATPAATQPIHLSAFGGLTGAYTGLSNSRNLSLTAGFDVSFKPYQRFYPTAELRGTYPMDSGALAGERNFLAGLKVERPYRQVFHPYGDLLYGRNKIVYQNGGYPNASGTLLYESTVANVLALGGGVDIDLTPHFAAKFDGQFERYQTPVNPSGHINSAALTAGVVYRIDFNHHFHYDRRTDQVTNLPRERAPKAVPPPPPPAPDASALAEPSPSMPEAAPAAPDAAPQTAQPASPSSPARTSPDPAASPASPAPPNPVPPTTEPNAASTVPAPDQNAAPAAPPAAAPTAPAPQPQ